MSTLLWIIIFGFLMSFIALVGSLTLIFPHLLVERTLLALVAFAAGSLLGGAILHMIPAAVEKMGNKTELYVWFLAGFVLFLALEQFLMWHHSHTHSHYACSPLSAPHQHDMPACIGEKCTGREGEGPSTNGRTELFAATPTRNDTRLVVRRLSRFGQHRATKQHRRHSSHHWRLMMRNLRDVSSSL